MHFKLDRRQFERKNALKSIEAPKVLLECSFRVFLFWVWNSFGYSSRRRVRRERKKIPRIKLLNSYRVGAVRKAFQNPILHIIWRAIAPYKFFFSFLSPVVSSACGWEWVSASEGKSKPTLLLLHFWCGSEKKFSH